MFFCQKYKFYGAAVTGRRVNGNIFSDFAVKTGNNKKRCAALRMVQKWSVYGISSQISTVR